MAFYYFDLAYQKGERKHKRIFPIITYNVNIIILPKNPRTNNSAFPLYLTKVIYVYMCIYIIYKIYTHVERYVSS